MKVTAMIEKLQNMNPNDEICAIIWSTVDVLGHAKHLGIKINKTQAKKVLQICDSRHDAEVGVNWDVLACHIDTVTEDGL